MNRSLLVVPYCMHQNSSLTTSSIRPIFSNVTSPSFGLSLENTNRRQLYISGYLITVELVVVVELFALCTLLHSRFCAVFSAVSAVCVALCASHMLFVPFVCTY